MTRDEIERVANAKYEDNTFAYKGFIAGAQWRINSVWHKVSEKPNGMFLILIDCGDGIGAEEYRFGLIADDLEGAKRWAYISDLLPERKEVRNDTESRIVSSSL